MFSWKGTEITAMRQATETVGFPVLFASLCLYRLVPMASISSMKTMEGACSSATRNSSRTSFGPSPRYFWISSDPTTRRNVADVWFATAFANNVFPAKHKRTAEHHSSALSQTTVSELSLDTVLLAIQVWVCRMAHLYPEARTEWRPLEVWFPFPRNIQGESEAAPRTPATCQTTTVYSCFINKSWFHLTRLHLQSSKWRSFFLTSSHLYFLDLCVQAAYVCVGFLWSLFEFHHSHHWISVITENPNHSMNLQKWQLTLFIVQKNNGDDEIISFHFVLDSSGRYTFVCWTRREVVFAGLCTPWHLIACYQTSAARIMRLRIIFSCRFV